MSKRSARDGGFALLIVLWTMVLVSLIGIQVTAIGRGAVQVASNLRASAELEAAADGAVHEAIFRLLDPTAAGWRADGMDRSMMIGPLGVALRLEDQAGKINPNLAQPDLLAAFLRQLGVEVQQVDDGGEVRGETYRETGFVAAADSVDGLPRLRVQTQPVLLDLVAGSYVVSLEQPLANLAVAALEPESPYGFAVNRVVADVRAEARVLGRPVLKTTPVP